MPLTGFKTTIDSHQWVNSRVVHTVDDGGFITHLELEIKIKDIEMTDDEQTDE